MRESAYREHYEVEDRHWWFRGRWAVIEALLSRAQISGEARILDAGCGTGGNLTRYTRMGDATGVDPSPDAVRFCQERGFASVQQAGLESLPFADGSFDVIAATDVVEHIEAEHQALKELRRVAAPNGVMLLTVPAYKWMWTEEDENLHHKRRYTKKRLRQAVERAGWQPQVVTYFNTILLPAIALARFLPQRSNDKADLERTPPALDGPLSLPMRFEARLIRAGVALPAGVSVGIVCRNLG